MTYIKGENGFYSKGDTKGGKIKHKINADHLFELIQESYELDKLIKEKNDELVAKKNQLKAFAREQYLNLYNEHKENPGSLIIEANDGVKTADFVFMVKDMYPKVQNDKMLTFYKEKYGMDILDSEISCSLNSSFLEKYLDVINTFIQTSPSIADEDRDNLINVNTIYNVKKGIINDLFKVVEDKNKTFESILNPIDIDTVLEDIKPVVSLGDFDITE